VPRRWWIALAALAVACGSKVASTPHDDGGAEGGGGDAGGVDAPGGSGSSSGLGSESGASSSSGGSGSGSSSGGGAAECGAPPSYTILATVQPSFGVGLAVDATSVYWYAQTAPVVTDAGGGGAVMKVPLGGGAVTTLATGFPTAMALGGSDVFWVEGGPNSSQATIESVPIAGGTSTTIAIAIPPTAVASDGTNVYWTDGAVGTVIKMPIGGAAPITLASQQENPVGLAIDAKSAYWGVASAAGVNGAIVKAPLSGGQAAVTLATGAFLPADVAVDAANVYWSTVYGTQIFAAPIAGGAITTLASQQENAFDIAADGTNVYWTSSGTVPGTSSVMKVPVGGGTPTALVCGLNVDLAGITVDATSVYWLDHAGDVLKLTPK
jgi:hypothetical protein